MNKSNVSCLLVSCAALLGCSEPVSLDWSLRLSGTSQAPPLVTAEYIAVGNDKGVAIVEPDGTFHCQFETRGEVMAALSTHRNLIYFGSMDYTVYAIDSQCQLVWKFKTRDRIKGAATITQGKVVVTSYDGKIYALDAAKGHLKWKFPTNVDTLVDGQTWNVGDFGHTAPLAHQGRVYAGNQDRYLYAVAATSGHPIWRFECNSPLTTETALWDGALVFGTRDGGLYSLDLETQVVRWRFQAEGELRGSPAIVDGTLYVGSKGRKLYALDAMLGTELWQHEVSGPVVSTVAVTPQGLFAAGGSGDGTLYALRRSDGGRVWHFATDSKVAASPVINGDRLYAMGGQDLYAFELGPFFWSTDQPLSRVANNKRSRQQVVP